MTDADRTEPVPHDRLDNFEDENIHRIRVSPRMLNELLVFGITTSTGTSEFGPELLVLKYTGDAEDLDIITRLQEQLRTLHGARTTVYSSREDSDA